MADPDARSGARIYGKAFGHTFRPHRQKAVEQNPKFLAFKKTTDLGGRHPPKKMGSLHLLLPKEKSS